MVDHSLPMYRICNHNKFVEENNCSLTFFSILSCDIHAKFFTNILDRCGNDGRKCLQGKAVFIVTIYSFGCMPIYSFGWVVHSLHPDTMGHSGQSGHHGGKIIPLLLSFTQVIACILHVAATLHYEYPCNKGVYCRN